MTRVLLALLLVLALLTLLLPFRYITLVFILALVLLYNFFHTFVSKTWSDIKINT